MARTPKKRKQPRCHSCHRRSLRWLEGRQRFMCDSCGKVFDLAVVERHNPGLQLFEPQLHMDVAQSVGDSSRLVTNLEATRVPGAAVALPEASTRP
jgi:predicted RNA-binding Zn-ribbon protein involved in translation (DUF1610 family)